jgi:hypothetical protein
LAEDASFVMAETSDTCCNANSEWSYLQANNKHWNKTVTWPSKRHIVKKKKRTEYSGRFCDIFNYFNILLLHIFI